MILKILMIGDTYAKAGRDAVAKFVPQMKKEGLVDFVVCNGENTAEGSGITSKIADELFSYGCDVITCGDHAFDRRKEIEQRLASDDKMLRPANFASGVPGKGSCVVTCKGFSIGVIHLAGQVFMRYFFSSAFSCIDQEIASVRAKGAQMILVDFHAEATSEKMAMSWHVDGRVSAIVGTHTHVQTADERISKNGTAMITDLGMTGPYDSVIGAEKEQIIQRFITQIGGKKEAATQDARLSGALISVDTQTGKSVAIERIHLKLNG